MNQVDPRLREYVHQELTNVANLMRKEPNNPRGAVFYFPAAYASFQRVFNIQFSPQAVLLYAVLRYAHMELSAAVGEQAQGQYPPRVPDDIGPRLASLCEQLAERIKAGDSYDSVLEDIATLSYSLSGNGLYLAQSGTLPVS